MIYIKCDDCGKDLEPADDMIYCESCYSELEKVLKDSEEEIKDLEAEVKELQETIEELAEVYKRGLRETNNEDKI